MYAWMEPCNEDNITEYARDLIDVDVDGAKKTLDVYIGYDPALLHKEGLSLESYIKTVMEDLRTSVQDDFDKCAEFRALPDEVKNERLYDTLLSTGLIDLIDPSGTEYERFIDP